MDKTNIQKTLYIPLYGKAFVTQKGLFLSDKAAEEIWSGLKLTLKGKAKSKWLAYYMGIRAAVFDEWTRTQLTDNPNAVVLHLGCGLDSRALRVQAKGQLWYDVDFPEVIAQRKRHYEEFDGYTMLGADINEGEWLDEIANADIAIVVMEGVSMYLSLEQLQTLFTRLGKKFQTVALLMDSYSVFAAKMSKIKNPVKEVGVTQVYGLDDFTQLERGGFVCTEALEMTPAKYVNELQGGERKIFEKLYAGGFSKKLYRLHAFEKK